MRAFKKALMAFAAVTAVSAAFAATSFADSFVAEYKEGKVTVASGLENVSGQMTVLLIEKGADADGITEDEILYINQAGANGNATFGEMGVLNGALEEGKVYTLKVGSDADGFEILSFDIDLSVQEEEKDVFCNVNKDTVVSMADVTALVQHLADIVYLSYSNDAAEYMARCNANGDEVVSMADVTALVQHLADIKYIDGLKLTDKQ